MVFKYLVRFWLSHCMVFIENHLTILCFCVLTELVLSPHAGCLFPVDVVAYGSICVQIKVCSNIFKNINKINCSSTCGVINKNIFYQLTHSYCALISLHIGVNKNTVKNGNVNPFSIIVVIFFQLLTWHNLQSRQIIPGTSSLLLTYKSNESALHSGQREIRLFPTAHLSISVSRVAQNYSKFLIMTLLI